MKDRWKILILSILTCSLFGIADYLYACLLEASGFKVEGLFYMITILGSGQLVYLSAGLIYGIIFLIASLILAKFGTKPEDIYAIEISILTSIFFFLLVLATSPNCGKWRLLLLFCLFGIVSVLTGYGFKNLFSFLKDFFGGPIRAVYFLYLSLLVSTGFILFWIQKFPVYDRAKLLMVVIATALFLFSALIARILVKKKSPKMILGFSLFIIILCLMLPFMGYQPVRKKPLLGKPGNQLNIIWIIADACRADAVGIYSGKNETPNIDQLAREGVLFKNAFAQAPWTVPSVLSMTTSFYPSIFQSPVRLKIYYGFNENVEFFQERLGKFGYRTYAVSANYAIGSRAIMLKGYDRIYGVFNDYSLQKTKHYRVLLKTDYLFRRFLELPRVPDSTAMVTEKAKKILKKTRSPFFLWIHYLNPHQPYNPPEEFLRGISYNGLLQRPFFVSDHFHLSDDLPHPQLHEINLGLIHLTNEDKQYIHQLYLANLRYLDKKIGELLKTIKEQNLDKNTVIIFTADHGEEFWEHDQWSHGHSLYDELLHIPLVIWGAGLKPKVIEEPVGLIDIVPFLADITGIEKNPLWQGESFFQALENSSFKMKREAFFAEGTIRPEDMKAIRTKDYKLIIGTLTGKRFLFNLKDDPGEQKNIYEQEPLLARELEEKLNLWHAENLFLKNKLRSREMSAQEKKDFDDRLRALGYIK